MRHVHLHLGADKCGSSAIQAFLASHPILRTGQGSRRLRYICLRDGILRPKQIKAAAARRIDGVLPSISIPTFLARVNPQTAQRQLASMDEDLILSCEGWLRECSDPVARSAFLDLFSPAGVDGPATAMHGLVFVRPPVSWLNSAWWQWGSWSHPGRLESWLEESIPKTFWASYLNDLVQDGRWSSLRIEPLGADVVSQLLKQLQIPEESVSALQRHRANPSLSLEAAAFFQRHPYLRPEGRRGVVLETLLAMSGEGERQPRRPTPWVLSREQIAMIQARTHDANHCLLDFLSAEHRQQVEQDPRWWSVDAYAQQRVTAPQGHCDLSSVAYDELAADLLLLLKDAIDVIQDNDLVAALDDRRRGHRAALRRCLRLDSRP